MGGKRNALITLGIAVVCLCVEMLFLFPGHDGRETAPTDAPPAARLNEKPQAVENTADKGNNPVRQPVSPEPAWSEADTQRMIKREAEWLMAMIGRNELSVLDMEYGYERLRIALRDPEARTAFEQYVLQTLGRDPNATSILESTMRSLSCIDPSLFDALAQRAIQQKNGQLLGSIIASWQFSHLPADGLIAAVRSAEQLNNRYALYQAAKALGSLPASRESTAILRELYDQGESDLGIRSHVVFSMSENSLIGPEDLPRFEAAAHGATSPDARCGAFVHLRMATFDVLRQRQDASASEIRMGIRNVLVSQLDDPDPILQIIAARGYEQFHNALMGEMSKRK